jgi:tetraacyldisaccharide 4'-kinase
MNREELARWLWNGPARRAWALWPFEAIFKGLVRLRAALYHQGFLSRRRVAVPVVVVGNLTVGGAGKTTVVAWLAARLRERGARVGIVLRGYRGTHERSSEPLVVDARSDPAVVGDEAMLHVLQGANIVVVGRDRVAAAEQAVRQGAELILCDDGLQHLRLARNCEVVVIDPAIGFGNGRMLPAGPMREPLSRLSTVNAIVEIQRTPDAGSARHPYALSVVCRASYRLGDAVNLVTRERRPLASFAGQRVRAVAGVGQPAAFFRALRRAGLDVEERAVADHADAAALAEALEGAAVALMTGKDAVKCADRPPPGWWYVELELDFAPSHAERLLAVVLDRVHRGVRFGGQGG